MPPWLCKARSTYAVGFTLLLLTSLPIFFLFNTSPSTQYHHQPPTATLKLVPLTPSPLIPRIARATIQYPSSISLSMSSTQNPQSNYIQHTLTTPLTKGAPNTLLYLLSLLLSELQKPVEYQVSWILYSDPDLVLDNTLLPLHILLPPWTEDGEMWKYISIMATKPKRKKMSGKVLWVKVGDAAVRILTVAVAGVYDSSAASERHEDEDGDREDSEVKDIASQSLQHILSQPQNRKNVLYHPASWYNSTSSTPHALFRQPQHSSPLSSLLSTPPLPQPPDPSSLAQASARITREAEVYFATVSEALRVLNVAKEQGQTDEKGEFQGLVRELREWVEIAAWETEELRSRVEELKTGLGID